LLDPPSCYSASTAPMSRMTTSRLGKLATTSVRRRISRFNCALGFFDQIRRHISRGIDGEREQVRLGGLEGLGDGSPAGRSGARGRVSSGSHP